MPNYAEILRESIDMLKKDKEVKWTVKARESFTVIKRAFGEAPILNSPSYQKPFLMFYFASPNTVIAILLQKTEEEKEQAVAFFSQVLRDVELKYGIMEK